MAKTRNGKMAMIITCLSVCRFCIGIETDPNKYRIIWKSVLGYDINYYDPNDVAAASKSNLYWYAPDKEWWYNPNGSKYVLTEDEIKTVAEVKWISEHTPDEDRGWHLSEEGLLTGNIRFWLICLSGCISYLVDIKWLSSLP